MWRHSCTHTHRHMQQYEGGHLLQALGQWCTQVRGGVRGGVIGEVRGGVRDGVIGKVRGEVSPLM